jgi:MinD-like ATPase involved in chromosome partitioning or flagellar assembly
MLQDLPGERTSMTATTERLKLISVHSYKGGVGKSTLATLLGLALAEQGKKVCFVDLDLLAPGLHHMLGVADQVAGKAAVLDYLIADAAGNAKGAGEVIHRVRPAFAGFPDRDVWLVPGKPILTDARNAQAYLAAEARAGLVRARLERLLHEVWDRDGANGPEVFLLDTPPSLFGVSAAVRGLVETHQGALIFVCQSTTQDLAGTWGMLYAVDEEEPEGNVAAARAIVLNRCSWKLDDPRANIRALFGQSARPADSRRTLTALVGKWLKAYEAAWVPEDEAYQRMVRATLKDEPRPSLAEVLSDNLRQLADALFAAVDGEVSADDGQTRRGSPRRAR